MPLSRSEQREFDRQLATRMASIKDEGVYQLAPVTQADFSTEAVNGAEATSHQDFYSASNARGNYVDFRRMQRANPHLSSEAREIVDRLCGEMSTFFGSVKSQNIVKLNALAEMYNPLYGLARQATPVAKEACLQYNQLEAENNAFESKANLTKFVVDYLNDPSRPIPGENEINMVREKLGIDLTAPALAPDRRVGAEPVSETFQALTSPLVDFNAFTQKMRAGSTTQLTQQELEYGVAAFDNNMSGLYGRGTHDLKPDDPNYLAKFDNIFINGEPVSALCADKTNSMTPIQKSNYMKCFVTSEAVARDKRIECVIPTADKSGLKVIPLTTQTNEKEPEKGLWARVVDRIKKFFGVKPTPTKQQNYEQMLASEAPQAKEERAERIKDRVIERQLGKDKKQILTEFHEAAAARKQALTNSFMKHEAEFFGSINGNRDQRNDALAQDKCNGVVQVDVPARRTVLARLYMYSKGDSLEQIYADTPEASALRERRGKEFVDIITEPDNAKAVGEMYANMGRALSNMPAPDISSDAALLNNMREIDFLSDSVTMFGSLVAHGAQANVYNQMVAAAGDDWQAVQHATAAWSSLSGSGLGGRMDFIQSPLYAATPAELATAKKFDNMILGATLYADTRVTAAIRDGFPKPGRPLRENTLTTEAMTAVAAPVSLEISDKSRTMRAAAAAGTVANNLNALTAVKAAVDVLTPRTAEQAVGTPKVDTPKVDTPEVNKLKPEVNAPEVIAPSEVDTSARPRGRVGEEMSFNEVKDTVDKTPTTHVQPSQEKTADMGMA